jgi:hypothetical protein
VVTISTGTFPVGTWERRAHWGGRLWAHFRDEWGLPGQEWWWGWWNVWQREQATQRYRYVEVAAGVVEFTSLFSQLLTQCLTRRAEQWPTLTSLESACAPPRMRCWSGVSLCGYFSLLQSYSNVQPELDELLYRKDTKDAQKHPSLTVETNTGQVEHVTSICPPLRRPGRAGCTWALSLQTTLDLWEPALWEGLSPGSAVPGFSLGNIPHSWRGRDMPSSEFLRIHVSKWVFLFSLFSCT